MIPTYENIMLPLLRLLSDGEEKPFSESVNHLADYFKLSKEEKEKKIPSGTQSIFYGRVNWAKTYLKKAGLLDIPKRGFIKITQRGMEILEKKPEKIDCEDLMKYDEFRKWKEKSEKTSNKMLVESRTSIETQSPEEIISLKVEEINNLVKDELKNKIVSLTPEQFEKVVIDILLKMGYGGSFEEASQHIGKSHDGGIDGIIKQDILGLDNVYIQAKQWTSGSVGRKELQAFVGAIHGKGKKGVFITTSQFTNESLEYAKSLSDIKVILIDGDKLVDYMIKFKIGVKPIRKYEILKIDEDYFEEF